MMRDQKGMHWLAELCPLPQIQELSFHLVPNLMLDELHHLFFPD